MFEQKDTHTLIRSREFITLASDALSDLHLVGVNPEAFMMRMKIRQILRKAALEISNLKKHVRKEGDNDRTKRAQHRQETARLRKERIQKRHKGDELKKQRADDPASRREDTKGVPSVGVQESADISKAESAYYFT